MKKNKLIFEGGRNDNYIFHCVVGTDELFISVNGVGDEKTASKILRKFIKSVKTNEIKIT